MLYKNSRFASWFSSLGIFLDESIESNFFSSRVFFPLIWKDSLIHMHGLVAFEKKKLPLACDLLLEKLMAFQPAFTCPKLTIEALKQGVKYVEWRHSGVF